MIYLDCSAVIDGARRYSLTRVWDRSLPYVLICGLNPSTADGTKDDPTIRKEVGFCKRLGFGGFIKVNAFSYRTKSTKLLAAAFRSYKEMEPRLGAGRNMTVNEQAIINAVQSIRVHNRSRAKIIVAWGNPPTTSMVCHLGNVRMFLRDQGELFCWGLTKNGHPRHPVRLPYATELVQLSVAQGRVQA